MPDPAETAQNPAEAPQTVQTPLLGPVTLPEAVQTLPEALQTLPEALQTVQTPPPEPVPLLEDIEKATAPAKASEPPPEPPYPSEIVCKCGRKVPADQKAKKPMGHRIGKEHPGFPGMSTAKRKQTWCPEGAERPPLPEKPPKKMSRRERRRG